MICTHATEDHRSVTEDTEPPYHAVDGRLSRVACRGEIRGVVPFRLWHKDEANMILGRVKGEVIATIKHPVWQHRRALLVDRITPEGTETGAYLVAFDAVDATVGQTVLMIDEGNSARQIIGDPQAPVRSVIIGIVDEIDVPSN